MEATNVPLVDLVVEIVVGDKSQKTSSKTKTSNPQWDELFEFFAKSQQEMMTVNCMWNIQVI